LENRLEKYNALKVQVSFRTILPKACFDERFKLGMKFFLRKEEINQPIQIPYEQE